MGATVTAPATAYQLRAAFDAAFQVRAWISVWEHEQPESPGALRDWASERGLAITDRVIDGSDYAPRSSVLCVERDGGQVCVYLRGRS